MITFFQKSYFIFSLILSLSFCALPSLAQDKLINILNDELQREIQVLKQQETPAYYISYRVDEVTGYSINTSFGAITYADESKSRYLTVTVRVGSPQMDNYHQLRDNSFSYPDFGTVELPSSDEPLAVKQVLWKATNDAYEQAIADFTKVKANIAVKVEEEDKSADFTLETPNTSLVDPVKLEDMKFDRNVWENRLKKYSSAFLRDSAIYNGSASAGIQVIRKFFVSSSGDKICQNFTAAKVFVNGTIKAKDGMEMPLYKSYFAYKPDGLPTDKTITNDVKEIVDELIALKNAPVAEPYTGPSLLSGRAASVFFHEIFGHRIEGQRMKNEGDAQTFKRKVNEQVLPASMSVYSDPLLTKIGNQDLNGYYVYDDQGTKAQRVSIVENGILRNFLMSRTPINGFSISNGHGRAQSGFQPASRQSNLIVLTSQPKTKEELRAELIKLAKEQNKPYGYLFDDVVGGFTITGRYSPNSFNVTPTLVYRVYADGRPDEVVRGVDLIGTPLSMFSQIDGVGDKTEVFNGYCGAESGTVPVSAACPMLLVKVIETQRKAKSQERSFILSRPDNN
jgi:predicted Zn-dependent protease